MTNRRDFLKHTMLASLTPMIPAFLRSTCGASTTPGETVLVVVQLAGGNDGLNTLVPYRDPIYHSARPKLRLTGNDVFRLNEDVGLHPSMRSIADLYERGQVAIVQGVGYPDPFRSHQVSTAVWQSARPGRNAQRDTGWLGRFTDQSQIPLYSSSAATTTTEEVPMLLRGKKTQVATISQWKDYVLPIDLDELRSSTGDATTTQSSITKYVENSSLAARVAAERFRAVAERRSHSQALGDSSRLNTLENPLAKQLSTISDLIHADFGPRIYFAAQPEYDTHFDQLGTHDRLLSALSRSLHAFLEQLDARGHGDRVMVMCFSEFGRQVQENSGGGTDHGTAGPVFILGNKVKSGIHGKELNLEVLVDAAPHHTVDFRDVYAGVLKGWLGVDSTDVLDGHPGMLAIC